MLILISYNISNEKYDLVKGFFFFFLIFVCEGGSKVIEQGRIEERHHVGPELHFKVDEYKILKGDKYFYKMQL